MAKLFIISYYYNIVALGYYLLQFVHGYCEQFQYRYEPPKYYNGIRGLTMPFLKVSPELQYVTTYENPIYHTQYTVDSIATSFSINCSSALPVMWKIDTQYVYEYLTVTFHSERFNLNDSGNGSDQMVSCHTVTLHFSKIEEGLTGLYTCEDAFWPTYGERIYIYGGAAANESSNLIYRGKTIHASAQNYEIFDYIGFLLVACALNYPVNRTVELYFPNFNTPCEAKLKLDPGGFYFRDEGFDECSVFASSSYLNWGSPDFDRIKAQKYMRDGIRMQCYTESDASSQAEKDKVSIEVESSSPIAYTPSELNLTLYVNHSEPLKFQCKSRKPIVISTNWQYAKSLYSKYLPKDKATGLLNYWQYHEELEITLTPEHLHFQVSCSFRDEIALDKVTWNYELNYIDGYDAYSENENVIVQDRVNTTNFRCRSAAPHSLSAVFVPCSTFGECQMKSRFLYYPEKRFLASSLTVERNNFWFSIPSETAGLIRCHGFQTEAIAVIYVHRSYNGDREQGLLTSNEQQQNWKIDANPLLKLNVSEVFEGDYIFVNCSVPLMLLVSYPQWEFTYRNRSHFFVNDEFIKSTAEYTDNSEFVVSAEIQLPTLDVTEIACMNVQLAKATPPVWGDGNILKKTETKKERRRQSLPIKVKIRPPEISRLGRNLGIGFTILGVVLVSIFSYVIWYIRNQQNVIDKLREEEIKLFREGNPELLKQYENANTVAQNLPFDENNEIDPLKLNIDYKNCLGSGEFGVVYKAIMIECSTQVAVKIVKAGASANYMRAAMSELKVMLFLKSHENVVKVIGACTQDLLNHKLVVVMEFCSNGDLLSYIRKHSSGFISLVRNGKLIEPSSALRLTSEKNKSSEVMSTADIINWAGQIANGMKYISSRNIIHGDLALRNILLDSNLQVKISDFGLSKKLYEYSNYVRKNEIPLPWRWLAVESLTFTQFSIASDVWAYGITLWELFSLGKTPYPGQQFNTGFVNMITNGFRLPLPEYAPYDLYDLMLNCWSENPADRPKFIEIHSKLDPASYEYRDIYYQFS